MSQSYPVGTMCYPTGTIVMQPTQFVSLPPPAPASFVGVVKPLEWEVTCESHRPPYKKIFYEKYKVEGEVGKHAVKGHPVKINGVLIAH